MDTSQQTSGTARTAELITHAEHAHRRAERMLRAAEAHRDRADAAREFARLAANRISGHRGASPSETIP